MKAVVEKYIPIQKWHLLEHFSINKVDFVIINNDFEICILIKSENRKFSNRN